MSKTYRHAWRASFPPPDQWPAAHPIILVDRYGNILMGGRTGEIALLPACGSGAEMTLDRGGSPRTHQEVLVVLEPEAGVDDEERERLSRQLRDELTELDIDAMTTVGSRPAPAGSKGVETWGDLLITLSASGGVVTSVLATIQQWLGRHHAEHQVKVVMDGESLELSRASSAEQAEIIQTFLRRHGGA